MLQTRLSARLARRLPSRTQKRFESSHSSADAHGHGHGAHHAAPVNESFGSGLYVMLAVGPLAYYIYRRGKNPSSEPSWLASLIPDWQGEWEQRNSLHTMAVEQAGRDRALFNSVEHSNHVQLRFNEVFNTGSPYNKHSGNGVNLEKVVEHYKRENKKMEEKIANKTPEQRFASGGSG